MERRINALLIALIALDVWIAAVAFVTPGFWFSTIHGAANVDPQGLLQRMGGNWSAFALVQLIALFRWRERPYWLTIVAGVRLSDMFTDWSCLFFCHDITWFGRIALFAAAPSNVLIGWYLIHTYRKLEKR
jgi:hypothetical protein